MILRMCNSIIITTIFIGEKLKCDAGQSLAYIVVVVLTQKWENDKTGINWNVLMSLESIYVYMCVLKIPKARGKQC